MKNVFTLTLATALTVLSVSAQGYETTIPDEDHLAYFDLRGPVQEVREYDYANHAKALWQFDKQGRLTHYEAYATPFAGNGGCVFGLTDRYSYAYDDWDGHVIVQEAFNEVENLVDENDGKILTLFPMREPKDVLFEQASKEYGDTTYCYSRWYEKEGDPLQHYHGRRYDKYGNWIEDFVGTEDSYSYTDTRVREIKYYKDIELFDLPVGVRCVTHQWPADGKSWANRYDFDREGNMTHFCSWVKVSESAPIEQLFEWDVNTDSTPGSDLISADMSEDVKREVYFYSSVPVGEFTALPIEQMEKDAFHLVFTYMGHVFQGNLYPLHNNLWVVMSRMSLEEIIGDPYEDPFGDKRYPVIWTDSVSTGTRNYNNQTIKLYYLEYGEKAKDKLKVQCSVQVMDADTKTRRLFCRTNPNNWDYEENPQYYSVIGWLDEEWTCSNLVTTCP